MPLSVGGLAPPAPPPPAPAPAEPGTLLVEWHAPDGSMWPLCDRSRPWLALADWSAVLGAAPIAVTTDEHPRGGATVRHVQPQPRIMVVPVRVAARTHLEFVAAWRQITAAFVQTRRKGPGRLRIIRPDATAREIEARYDGGIVGEPGQTPLRDVFVLQLFCESPWWRDVVPPAPIVREFGTPVDYYSPYWSLSSGRVLGATTVHNDGEVEAWPVWTITGPMSELEAVNHTTGDAFTLTATLLAAEKATIVTDPPQVRGPAGENWTGFLDWPDAVLWPLAPGANDVEFNLTGAVAGSRVELAYRRRYETP